MGEKLYKMEPFSTDISYVLACFHLEDTCIQSQLQCVHNIFCTVLEVALNKI